MRIPYLAAFNIELWERLGFDMLSTYVACFLLLQHFLCHVFIDAWCVICFGIDIQRCLDSMGK